MKIRDTKYGSLSEWRKAEPKAYAAARDKGYIEEICLKFGWIIPSYIIKPRYSKKDVWTKEHCIESAKKFKSMLEWKNSEYYMYKVAMHNRWLDEIRLFLGFKLVKPKKIWTKERCIEEAKQYDNKGQWRKNSGPSYGRALAKKWLDECCAHMTKLQTQRPAKTWKDKNTCLESAKAFNNPSAWSKAFPGAYSSARKNGWFKEATAHMNRRKTLPNGYWNIKENVLIEAKKYKTKYEWSIKSGSSHHSAKKNGWFEEATAHMIKNKVAQNG